MNGEPGKQLARPGQTWTAGSALLSLLADTPLTVTAVRGGIVHFTSASGLPVRFPEPVFRALFDPAPS